MQPFVDNLWETQRSVGLKSTDLKRIRIGKVELGILPLGQRRYLGESEQF